MRERGKKILLVKHSVPKLVQHFPATCTPTTPTISRRIHHLSSRFKHPSDSVPLNCAEWHNLNATLRLIIVYEVRPCSLCSTTARSLFERERQRQTAGWVYVPELINLQPLRLHAAVPPSLILSF